MSKNRDYDWATIQAYYDTGKSIRDVVREFGVSNLTVQRARDKGLFSPRERNELRKQRAIVGVKPDKPVKPKVVLPKCDNTTCNNEVKRKESRYCGQSCHFANQYREYIDRWLKGEETGSIATFERISLFVRRHLIEHFGECCSRCGWCEVNEFTGKIPVQVDHVDGDPLNNRPDNLRLLCPSCHSLTPTWGRRGKGRPHRRDRYKRKTTLA